jgi:hypothetical protein
MKDKEIRDRVEAVRNRNADEHFHKYVLPFKKYLQQVKDSTNATLEELADGLGISKQVIIKFLKDNDDGEKYELPIGRASLISLCETLSNPEIYEKRERQRKILRSAQRQARAELKVKGLDEMLKTLGLQPVSNISDDRISPVSINKCRALISRLSGDYIDDDFVWKIEEYISKEIKDHPPKTKHDTIENKPNNPSASTNDNYHSSDREMDILRSLEGELISDVDRECFIAEIERYKGLGKEKFETIEIVELFHSIKQNLQARVAISPESIISVFHCEVKPLDLYHQILRQFSRRDTAYRDIVKKIYQLGQEAEFNLGLKYNKGDFLVLEDYYHSSLTQLELSCRTQKNKEFTWVYRSNFTALKSIINAVTIGIGIKSDFVNFSNQTLSSGSDSLIKFSCIAKFGIAESGSI